MTSQSLQGNNSKQPPPRTYFLDVQSTPNVTMLGTSIWKHMFWGMKPTLNKQTEPYSLLLYPVPQINIHVLLINSE